MRRYPGYLLFLPLFLFANPQGEQVTSGSCQFDRSGSSLTIIQHSEHAIIDWQHFSVQFNETTHFLQSPTSAVLNRVVGNNPTEIHGTLKSTGMVYLINQNGILIGPNGRIQTGGFLASTLELASGENLGEDLLFKGTHDASIDFQGSIETPQGPVYFISRNVYENGKVEADSVHLLAGTEVFISHPMGGVIKVSGEGKLEQKGTIEALKMELQSAGSADSFAIQQEGILHASGFLEDEGRIILCSDQGSISVSGSMHASQNEHGGTIHVLGEEIQVHEKALVDVSAPSGGGEILIGGDYQGENSKVRNATNTTVHKKALFLADATEKGDGGKVIVWADDTTKFHGHISAQALGDSGDGGFAEVSGKNELWISGHADLRAKNGDFGTMLCDPGPVLINNVAAGVGPNTFQDTFIVTQLGLGNFTISTANGTLGGVETLTFASGGTAPNITWADNTTFTAIGRRNTVVNNGTTIENTGSGSINIQGNAITGGANYIGVSIGAIGVATIRVANGTISISGTGGDTIGSNVGIFVGGGSIISALGSSSIIMNGTGGPGTSNNRGVFLTGAGTAVSSVSGSVNITGQGGGTTSGNAGVLLTAGAAISSDTGTINVVGTGGPGGTIGNHGVNMSTATITSNISAEINVTATGGSPASGASNGIQLFGSATTNITSIGSGMITVNAIGGAGSDSMGLFLRGTTAGSPTNITTFNGDVLLRGTATGTGVNCDGITIFNATGPARVESTGTGTLTLIGVATGTLGIGVHLNAPETAVTSTDPAATISLTGTGAGAGTGIRLDGSDFIGTTTTAAPPPTVTTAPIILTADDMRLSGPVSTSGTITVQPLSPTASMGIGPSAPGVLTLNAIDLANLGSLTSPSMIIFGRSNGASTTSTDPTILTLIHPTTIQNANVDVLGPLAIGLNDLTVNIGTNGTGAFNLFDDITTTGGVIQVNGAGPAQNMTFNAFNNTVNTWNINSQNAGVFNSGAGFAANFSNVGNLVGGNQDDTFVFVNQQGLSGIVDGGFPPAINTLDYAGWNPPAIVQFIGPFDGIASNIDGGFFNIFRAVGNFTDSIVPNIPATFNTQVDLSFLYLFLQGKDDDLFTLFDIYLLSKVIYFPNALWLDIFADVLYQQEKDSLDILPLYQIIQDVPDPFVRGRLPHFAE